MKDTTKTAPGVRSQMTFKTRETAYFVAGELAKRGYRSGVQVILAPTKSVVLVVNCSVEQAESELKSIAAMLDDGQPQRGAQNG